jgi:hypothetical protein
MAVRKPVYWDGSAVRSMTSAQITAIKQRCVYLFGGSGRPVNLTYDAGNAGAGIRRMLDTRDTAGALATGGASFPTPAAINDGGASTTYDYVALSQTDGSPSEPADTNNIAFPLYQESTNVFRSMSRDDMYDTFINDAIDLLVDGNDRDGTYRVSTSSSGLSNHTIVNANPIFTDQRFNAAGVHGGATGTSSQEILPLSDVDQPLTIQNYYLWRTDQGTSYGTPSIQLPLQTNTDEDLVTYSTAAFDTLLENLLFYSTASRSNYILHYNFEAAGVDAQAITDNVSTPQTRGDAIVDTTLDASVRINDQDGADAYRSQNLPTGSPEIETTYTLKIYRK